MSSAYLFIRSRHGIEDARRRSDFAARYSPIVAEKTQIHEFGTNSICIAFANAEESAAGNYVHKTNDGAFVVFNGWVAGNLLSDQPFPSSVASWISERIQSTSFDDFVRDTTGEWSALAISPNGEIQAGLSFPGGEHLYYGFLDGVLVISNRALLCAAALHENIPAPNPFFVGWLLTKNHAFVSDDGTPFANVFTLHPLKSLAVKPNAESCTLYSRPWPKTERTASFEELLDEMAERVKIVRRLPQVPFRFSLTGGRDSRLVLAALVAAKCFDKLRGCYLIAPEDHPDVIVGRLLAKHYGIPFECLTREASTRSIWDDLEIHHFQTELGIHFYDNKGVLSRPREGRMGGSYGEIFFSHFKFDLLLGWAGINQVFGSKSFVDPDGILTNRARDHFRQEYRSWCQKRREEGLLATHIRDRLHRDGRMWRWVGQGRLGDALGTINTNPIPSPKMFDKYLSAPYLDRRYGRIHYELMRLVDPWIAEHPFASKGFSRYLTGHNERRMKFPAAKRTSSPQNALWQKQRDELVNYLLSPSNSAFFELVDKQRLDKLLQRTPANASRVQVESVFGVIGVRHAIETSIKAHPCKVDPASSR